MNIEEAIIEMLERGGWANIPIDEHALVTELISAIFQEAVQHQLREAAKYPYTPLLKRHDNKA